jgi:hypothetical protein
MSDVGSITGQPPSPPAPDLSVQVPVSVLKKALDLQKETATLLLQSLGVGRNLDIQA